MMVRDPVVGERLYWVYWKKMHVEIAVETVEVVKNYTDSVMIRCLDGNPSEFGTHRVNLFRDRDEADREAASRVLEGSGLW